MIPESDRAAAFGFYTALLVYAQTYRTDGQVRRAELGRVFPCSAEERERLVSYLQTVDLLDHTSDGVYIHDFLDHNRSRAEIEEQAERMRQGGQKGGQRSGAARSKS